MSGLPLHYQLSEEAGVEWALSKQEFQLALLQHYGIPTRALDVTYEPLVALWFAVHRFIKVKERTGYYTKIENKSIGVIYMIETLEKNITDLKPGKTLPAAGLRGQRQCGGLLIGATSKKQDLFEHVTRKLFVTPKISRGRVQGVSEFKGSVYLIERCLSSTLIPWLLQRSTLRLRFCSIRSTESNLNLECKKATYLFPEPMGLQNPR